MMAGAAASIAPFFANMLVASMAFSAVASISPFSATRTSPAR